MATEESRPRIMAGNEYLSWIDTRRRTGGTVVDGTETQQYREDIRTAAILDINVSLRQISKALEFLWGDDDDEETE